MKRCLATTSQLTKLLFCLLCVLACLLKLLYSLTDVTGSHRRWLVEPFWSTSQFVCNRKYPKYTSLKFEINCAAIYDHDPVEVGKSLEIRNNDIVDLEDEDVASMVSNCEQYLHLRGYHSNSVSEEELGYPLAYSLVVHKNAIMVERILRAVYMPQNLYCIHYDQKSSKSFKSAMEKLASCLPNVFIASKLEWVHYAHISRLQADLNCLSDLLRSSIQWRYVINLCGQDFPLRSNYKLVSELKKLSGANMLESVHPSDSKKERFTYHHELQNVPYEYSMVPVITKLPKDTAPHNIEVFSGSAYFVLTREFVLYINNSIVAKDFLAWSSDTYSPDEHFWASMVRVPGVPGELPRTSREVSDLESKVRLVKWSYLEEELYPPCTGTRRRSTCIYGAAELRWLLNSQHWFANKFDSKVDPVLIKCLELRLQEHQRIWVEASSEKLYIEHIRGNIFGGNDVAFRLSK